MCDPECVNNGPPFCTSTYLFRLLTVPHTYLRQQQQQVLLFSRMLLRFVEGILIVPIATILRFTSPTMCKAEQSSSSSSPGNNANPASSPATVLRMPTRAIDIECFTSIRSLYYLSSKSNSLPLIWSGSEVVSRQQGILVIQFWHRVARPAVAVVVVV